MVNLFWRLKVEGRQLKKEEKENNFENDRVCQLGRVSDIMHPNYEDQSISIWCYNNVLL